MVKSHTIQNSLAFILSSTSTSKDENIRFNLGIEKDGSNIDFWNWKLPDWCSADCTNFILLVLILGALGIICNFYKA